ncbi:DUF484 family protein [Xylophilus sp. ASV27]|uniref:DUF484 family protein n=1 Tax=Xylophilus sp. ASV27 TaxID=2795129 RepID=UPI0018EAC34F|nr:DUF484 family protein [Xylophilus sp. ASV27]
MTTLPQATVPPITEDDIANYLANSPDFFERHAEVLASVQLTSPHGQRAVSLQERQAEMLREKIKALEQRVMEMVRNGNENTLIADRLQRWAVQLAGTREAAELPARMVAEAQEQFLVPQAAIRLWDLAPQYAGADFTQGVDADTRSFAASLGAPYCGPNRGFDSVRWLAEPARAASLALLPLRQGPAAAGGPVFGLLVLASADASRFETHMGTDFLERMAELAGAALGRLRAA